MLDAKASSGMNQEEFAAWLAPFGLSQDRLLQCLELGQVTFDHQNAEVTDRQEPRVSREAIRREEEQWARQREEQDSERRQRELLE
jgi:hypothetical protein